MNSAQPSIGPWEPPLKYLVISIIWSLFFFTIPRYWRWSSWFCQLESRSIPGGGFSRLFFLPNQEINSPRLPGECDAIFCDLDIPIPHMAGKHGSDLPILSVFTTWCQVSTGARLSPHTTPLESKSVKLPSPSSDDFSKAHLESYIDPPPLH